MFTRFASSLAGLVTCCTLGCAPQVAIYTEHDPNADFSGLSTWDWAKPKPAVAGEQPKQDPILDARIRAAIEVELGDLGFKRDDGGTPTFLVAYTAATEESMQSWAIDDYYGYSRPTYRFYAGRSRNYPLGTGTQREIVYEYQEGSLVLDVSTPDTHRLLWRAYARSTIEPDQKQETRDKRLRDAVRKMLKGFPPR